LSFCPYSKRLTHLMRFSVCASLPPVASLDDVSSTCSNHDVLHDPYSWKGSLNKQELKENKGNELRIEEMSLPILILHKLVLGLGSGRRRTVCVYCMLGERSKHIKSFSLEILGRKSSVGRQYLLKWTSEIKVVMMLYGMALCVLSEKNFRVAENSRLLSSLEIYRTIACGYSCHHDSELAYCFVLSQYCSKTFSLRFTRQI